MSINCHLRSNNFLELTQLCIVIENAAIDIKNSDCYCYCCCCYCYCYCYCCCYCDNVCQWSQVWTNHHLSADHFPRGDIVKYSLLSISTSSNALDINNQHRQIFLGCDINIVKYSLTHDIMRFWVEWFICCLLCYVDK